MLPLGQRWSDGVDSVLHSHQVPWHVTTLGARAEYAFSPEPPQHGAQAAAAEDFGLQNYLHLYALVRGVVLTPFHNMALMAPTTTEADVDAHTSAFDACLAELTS
jgi:glutamate-1-semialdehyde 2,1-aminomutase